MISGITNSLGNINKCVTIQTWNLKCPFAKNGPYSGYFYSMLNSITLNLQLSTKRIDPFGLKM